MYGPWGLEYPTAELAASACSFVWGKYLDPGMRPLRTSVILSAGRAHAALHSEVDVEAAKSTATAPVPPPLAEIPQAANQTLQLSL